VIGGTDTALVARPEADVMGGVARA